MLTIAPGLLLALAIGASTPGWKGGTGNYGWFFVIDSDQAGLVTLIIWIIASVSLLAGLLFNTNWLYKSWINFVMVLTLAAICHWHTCTTLIMETLPPVLAFFPFAPGVNLLLLAVYIYTRKELTGRLRSTVAFILTWLSTLAAAIYVKVILAHEVYNALPDTPPDCFIVTAAAQGNRRFVGSTLNPQTGRVENVQLARMRAFEQYLIHKHPGAHRLLRKVYNRVGPVVARRIQRPILADLMYVMLKPIELLAMVICRQTPRG
ncbi:MAG: hypothetical protein HN350_09090 [Phycisphaerales bacterium]|nr:hypothetical protein [Phycisphaerales bacterium]